MAFSQYICAQDHWVYHTSSQLDVLNQDLEALDQLRARLVTKIAALAVPARPVAARVGFPVTYAVIHNVSIFLGGEGDRVRPTRVCKAWLKCRGPARPTRRVTQINVYLHNDTCSDRPKYIPVCKLSFPIDAIEFLYDDGTAKMWGRPVEHKAATPASGVLEPSDVLGLHTPASLHILEDDELVGIEMYVVPPSSTGVIDCPTFHDVVFLTRRGLRLDPKLELRQGILAAETWGKSKRPEEHVILSILDEILPTRSDDDQPEVHRPSGDGPITYITADYHHTCFIGHRVKLAGIASVGDAHSLPKIRHVGKLPGHHFEFDRL